MRHPLENPSLAPFGFVFPIQQERLGYVPTTTTGLNCEKVIARLWAKWNRVRSNRPLPVHTIIHEILPSQAQSNRLSVGDFYHEGLPYQRRDIMVLSSAIQWFGTNIGRGFLEDAIWGKDRKTVWTHFHPEREFLIKFQLESRRFPLAGMWTHTCNKRCGTQRLMLGGFNHWYDPTAIAARDHALIDGLMRWLGKREGRAFAAEYFARRDRIYEARREKFRKKHNLPPRKRAA